MSFLKKIFKSREPESISSYENFWNWFAANETAFHKVVKESKDIEKNFFDKLSPVLTQVHEGIYFVTGMHNEATAELIFTAEGAIANIVFVEELVQAAPVIAGWKFTAFKPTLPVEDVSIRMAGYEFHSKNLHFYANDSDIYPDEIDITIVHDDMNEENRSLIINGIYIFLDNFLGELEFAVTIDNLRFTQKNQAENDLIPIEKLKDFLNWRQKEFVEKYEGARYDTEKDSHAVMEGQTAAGKIVVATINTDLLQWDGKASHPWIVVVELPYDGSQHNGLPDDTMTPLFEAVENSIMEELKDFEGYLNVGRQTSDNKREIYFACKDFRKPSKTLKQVQQAFEDQIEVSYEIYKDKYWQSFNRFQPVL